MSLNISKGNMYEFVTHTWNTVKGKCFHDCSYCYMKRWGNQRDCRFDQKELNTDLGEGNFIFVGSSCDMFNKDIQTEWMLSTYLKCCEHPNNKYLFQSKDPFSMANLLMFEKFEKKSIDMSFCTTIETNRVISEIMNQSPDPTYRAEWMSEFEGRKKYVTIEPIMDFDMKEFVDILRLVNPSQVNIGADSGGNNLPEPSYEKVMELVQEINRFSTVHNKKNLNRLKGRYK